MIKDQDYKKNVLDKLSPSFCAAKWYNATVWLGSGMTTSCHHPPAHKVDVDQVIMNPKALHNTWTKMMDRAKMRAGERPKGCEYCWKIEDMGDDSISDRVYKSKLYTQEELDYCMTSRPYENHDLITMEIAFDRTCNFACSYCNPGFSTTWAKDINDNGPYQGLVSDGRNHFTHSHESSQLYKPGEDNPYVEAFFKWWESDLHRTLRELRVTGGEPLMTQELWRLMDWFGDNASSSDTKLAVNSNLGGKFELIKKLTEKSHDIKHFHLYTSNESVGAQAEYIRDGLVWDDWVNNVYYILDNGNLEGFHIMATINALCLESLTDFLDYILDLKNKYGKDFPTFTLNILRFPSFQSMLVLPIKQRIEFAAKINVWLDDNLNNKLLHEMEINQTKRLIEYLQTMESPHSEATFDLNQLQHDFKLFYKLYDQRRGKCFADTFNDIK